MIRVVVVRSRRSLLGSFINARCTGSTTAAATADGDTTVGGSATGAPN